MPITSRARRRFSLIRNAFPKDTGRLFSIAMTAKHYWSYPDSHMERFKETLNINAEYILDARTVVRCEEVNNSVIAFFAVIKLEEPQQAGTVMREQGFWLDHMYVLPSCHRQGIGTKLFLDMKISLVTHKADRIRMMVDPNAKGFFEKMGATLLRFSDSYVHGRKIPVFEYRLPR